MQESSFPYIFRFLFMVNVPAGDPYDFVLLLLIIGSPIMDGHLYSSVDSFSGAFVACPTCPPSQYCLYACLGTSVQFLRMRTWRSMVPTKVLLHLTALPSPLLLFFFFVAVSFGFAADMPSTRRIRKLLARQRTRMLELGNAGSPRLSPGTPVVPRNITVAWPTAELEPCSTHSSACHDFVMHSSPHTEMALGEGNFVGFRET